MRKISIAEFRRSLPVGTEVSSLMVYVAPGKLDTVGDLVMGAIWEGPSSGASTERKVVKQGSYEMALTIGRRPGSAEVSETHSFRQYNKGCSAFTDDNGTFWVYDRPEEGESWDVGVNAYRITQK